MKPPVSSAQWWNQRYLAGDTRWNKGAVAPPIARMITEGVVPKGRVAVLGAGFGHEAIALARAGYDVTAIDFAQQACEAILAAAEQAGVKIEALQKDVLELPAGLRFDSVLEHTCYCAIDPERRDDYVRAVSRMLVPGGLFFGLFYAHSREGGPPFGTSEAEIREKFGPVFEFERLVRAPDSFPGRAGDELEFLFRSR
jgi:SAM-dependent methyltransferase